MSTGGHWCHSVPISDGHIPETAAQRFAPRRRPGGEGGDAEPHAGTRQPARGASSRRARRPGPASPWPGGEATAPRSELLPRAARAGRPHVRTPRGGGHFGPRGGVPRASGRGGQARWPGRGAAGARGGGGSGRLAGAGGRVAGLRRAGRGRGRRGSPGSKGRARRSARSARMYDPHLDRPAPGLNRWRPKFGGALPPPRRLAWRGLGSGSGSGWRAPGARSALPAAETRGGPGAGGRRASRASRRTRGLGDPRGGPAPRRPHPARGRAPRCPEPLWGFVLKIWPF